MVVFIVRVTKEFLDDEIVWISRGLRPERGTVRRMEVSQRVTELEIFRDGMCNQIRGTSGENGKIAYFPNYGE